MVVPSKGSEATFPTGTQFQLQRGETSATITSVGATIRSFHFQNKRYLEETPVNKMVSKARGQLLIPWPNRIRDGKYKFNDTTHQLPISEVEFHNSIHGLTRWQEFELLAKTSTSVTLRHHLAPSPGWPFSLETTISYELQQALLLVEVSLRNIGDSSAPVAFGAHPYFAIGETKVQDYSLFIPANQRWEVDQRKNPVELTSVTNPEPALDLDFRRPRRVGDTYLDYAFSDLIQCDESERRFVEVGGKIEQFDTCFITDGSTKVGIFYDENFNHIQAYFDPTSPSRTSIALEPMTSPPNAFNININDHLIKPSETKKLHWGIFVETSAKTE